MSEGSDTIRVLAGIVLLLFGVSLVLAGGLCSVFMFGAIGTGLQDLFFISLAVCGLGLLSIYAGWRCMQLPRNR